MRLVWGEDEKSKDNTFVNESKAIVIARKFLEQYHSPVIFRSLISDGKNWRVSMEVGLLKEEIIEVLIDTQTGQILNYSRQL